MELEERLTSGKLLQVNSNVGGNRSFEVLEELTKEHERELDEAKCSVREEKDVEMRELRESLVRGDTREFLGILYSQPEVH